MSKIDRRAGPGSCLLRYSIVAENNLNTKNGMLALKKMLQPDIEEMCEFVVYGALNVFFVLRKAKYSSTINKLIKPFKMRAVSGHYNFPYPRRSIHDNFAKKNNCVWLKV
jgi:hypothetical protein